MEIGQVVTRHTLRRNFADLPIEADQLERILDHT